ncbi:hypothetical protein LEMLEM_LOCUS13151, partial [Lemmus lemmus]
VKICCCDWCNKEVYWPIAEKDKVTLHFENQARLERWLNSYEYLLLFQRTRVQVPAPMSRSSQVPVTIVPRDQTTSFGLHGHCSH